MSGWVVGGGPPLSRVPPPARPAEKAVVADPQGGTRGGQLGTPVLAEAVPPAVGEMDQLSGDDLAQLTQRPGDQGDRNALRRVLGHRRAGANGLAVVLAR